MCTLYDKMPLEILFMKDRGAPEAQLVMLAPGKSDNIPTYPEVRMQPTLRKKEQKKGHASHSKEEKAGPFKKKIPEKQDCKVIHLSS